MAFRDTLVASFRSWPASSASVCTSRRNTISVAYMTMTNMGVSVINASTQPNGSSSSYVTYVRLNAVRMLSREPRKQCAC